MTIKIIFRVLVVFFLSLSLISCTNGNCRENREAKEKANPSLKKAIDTSMPVAITDKVQVYKYDGSLQCGSGEKIALQIMQKDLKDIKVYSSENKADGLMHIQLCGSPTGTANVYQIDRKDLSEAKKLGFKEWLWD